MKILITHANGFMGSYLIDLLLAQSSRTEKILGLYSPRTPTLKNLNHIENLREKVELKETSCVDLASIENVFKEFCPELIFHFERFTRPGHAWEQPQETYELNLTGTANLLKACVGLNNPRPRIVVETSAAIYGNVPFSQLPIKESCPLYLNEKSGPFEWSVVGQESLIRQFIYEYGLDVVIGRSFNIEGPRRRTGFVTSDFAQQIAKLEMAGDLNPIIRVGNLSARRDWTEVRDAARAYFLLSQKGVAGEVYNVGSGVVKSINEILTTLLNFSTLKNYRIEPDPKLTRPTDIPMLQADYSKIRNQTGWQPSVPFGQMAKEVLEDWRRRVRENEYD